MLQQERHERILNKLSLEGRVVVNELSQEFSVTPDCIRKDLAILEKKGALKRVHGGAMRDRENLHNFHVNQRLNVRQEEKKIIARKALTLIQPGDLVYLDISTINIEIARLLIESDMAVTIVTNMIDILNMLTQNKQMQMIFIGGTFNHARDGMVGAQSIAQIERLKCDISFLGTVGVDAASHQIYTYDIDDGLTKAAIIKSSKKAYVVLESAKFQTDGNYCYSYLNDVTGLITEQEKVSSELAQTLQSYNTKIL